jgi:hypothetical protein
LAVLSAVDQGDRPARKDRIEKTRDHPGSSGTEERRGPHDRGAQARGMRRLDQPLRLELRPAVGTQRPARVVLAQRDLLRDSVHHMLV